MKASLPTILKTAFPESPAEAIRLGCERVREAMVLGIRRVTVPVASFNIRGEVHASVVENGKVVREYPVQKNLILNRFMEDLFDRAFNRMFTYAVASIGTTSTTFDSGATEASQTGTTVTINTGTGSFTFDDTNNHAGSCVGNVIRFDSGEERRIVSRTSATVVEVVANPNGNVAQGQFTVYGTNQTRMADNAVGSEERVGPGSYLTGAGNCGRDENSSTGEISLYRTYDFAIRANGDRGAAGTPYKEIGFSDIATVGGVTINSRIVLTTPVAVEITQQLRIKYILIVTVSPIVAETVSGTPITGWVSAGKQQIQRPMLETVNTSGASEAYITGGASPLEPSNIQSSQVIASLSASAAAHNAFNTNGPDRSSGAVTNHHDTTLTKTTKQLYSAVSEVHRLSLDKQSSWAAAVGNGTWQSLVLGHFENVNKGCLSPAYQGFVYILDAAQTKDSVHSLDLAWRFTWSRTLS